jgi:hypothetical protein
METDQLEPLRKALGRAQIGHNPRAATAYHSVSGSSRSLLGPRNDLDRRNEARRRLKHWSDLMEEVFHSEVPFDYDVLQRLETKEAACKRQQAEASIYADKSLDQDTKEGREAKKVVNGFCGVVKAFREAVEQDSCKTRRSRSLASMVTDPLSTGAADHP